MEEEGEFFYSTNGIHYTLSVLKKFNDDIYDLDHRCIMTPCCSQHYLHHLPLESERTSSSWQALASFKRSFKGHTSILHLHNETYLRYHTRNISSVLL